MEGKTPLHHNKSGHDIQKPKQHVYVLRDLKEYLGESALIVFSQEILIMRVKP